MKRVLALDFGEHTVGVAVSDPLGITAQGVEVIRRERAKKLRQTLARIEALVKEYEASRIVLGYPKHLDGSEGGRCARTKEFAEMLKKRMDIPVVLWDERLTSVAAHRAMDEGGISKERQKERVDELAAVLILQSFLDTKNAEE